jgi:LysR family transcriptional regulator, low CO2-responsive transcriptional regulator
MKNATFRQLQVFNEVARHLSFARAAEHLFLTPPAVTMQIKELEGQVGLPLFERQGRRVSLTTAGEYMLVYARKILATVKDAENAALRLQRAEAGTLSLGIVGAASYVLMPMLARFRESHPAVSLHLQVGNRQDLLTRLQGSEVDLAVMGRPPQELNTRADLIAGHPHGFVAAPGHPLASETLIEPGALMPSDILVREAGSGTRAAMEAFLSTHTLPAGDWGLTVASNEALKQAVMAGLGIGFLSLHTVGLELRQGLMKVLPVRGCPVVRAWHLVRTPAKVLSPAAEALHQFILTDTQRFIDQLMPPLPTPIAESAGADTLFPT